MTIATKLTELNTVKQDIKTAIEAKGVSLTGVEFRNYDTKIAEIGGGELPYTRPSQWPAAATWVQGADHRIALVTRVVDDFSASYNGNTVQLRVTTNTGTWSVDWGDGTVETGIASNTNKVYTYTFLDPDLTDATSTLGYKLALIKVYPDSSNQITGFTTQNASGSGQQGYLEISANTPNCTTFTVFGTTFRNYCLESLIIYKMGAANLGTAVDNVVYGSLQNVVITSASITTTPTLNAKTLRYVEYNLTTTSAVTINNISTGSETFPSGIEKIVINLATNSNFTLEQRFRYNAAVKEILITNTGSGVVSNMSNAFVNCNNLEKITIPGATSTCTISQAFDRCGSIKQLVGFSGITSNTAFTANFRSSTQGAIDGLSTSLSFSGAATATFQQAADIYEIPAWNLSGVTSYTSTFESMFNLARFRATLPASLSVSFANCNLSAAALNEIYTNLPTASGTPTITVTGNPGTSGDNPTIATAKGWTVAGS